MVIIGNVLWVEHCMLFPISRLSSPFAIAWMCNVSASGSDFLGGGMAYPTSVPIGSCNQGPMPLKPLYNSRLRLKKAYRRV